MTTLKDATLSELRAELERRGDFKPGDRVHYKPLNTPAERALIRTVIDLRHYKNNCGKIPYIVTNGHGDVQYKGEVQFASAVDLEHV